MLKDGEDRREVEKRRVELELIKQSEGICHPTCSLRVQTERKIKYEENTKGELPQKGVLKKKFKLD